MRSTAIAVLGLLVVAGAARAQGGGSKAAAKQELQRLQGTWRVEVLETGGEKTAAADLKERTVFIGADALLVKDGKKVLQAAKMKLDPTKTPKTVNAVVILGTNKGEILLGIYELKGDTLRICLDMEGQNRPTEFKTAAKTALTLVECKRVPAVDHDLPSITGKYKSETVETDGTRHTADATIERHGDAYLVTYFNKEGKTVYVGIGIRRGNTFSMSWVAKDQIGLSVYQIEKGPRLVGEYTVLGNVGVLLQEVLTLKDKAD